MVIKLLVGEFQQSQCVPQLVIGDGSVNCAFEWSTAETGLCCQCRYPIDIRQANLQPAAHDSKRPCPPCGLLFFTGAGFFGVVNNADGGVFPRSPSRLSSDRHFARLNLAHLLHGPVSEEPTEDCPCEAIRHSRLFYWDWRSRRFGLAYWGGRSG